MAIFNGTTGNNVLAGTAGPDGLFGYEGDDTLGGGAGADTLDGGDGYDTVTYAGETAVTVDLVAGTGLTNLGGTTDTLIDIENIIGSAYGDALLGDAGPNRFMGGAGNDVIDGRGGADTAFFAGARSDFKITRNNDGTTTVLDLRNGSPEGGDTLRNIEVLQFNDGVFSTAPSASPNTQTFDANGGGGADILWRNTNNALAVWTMGGFDGTSVLTGNGIASSPGSSWSVQGVGDFNGDGKSDILWRNDSGALAIWTMGGTDGTAILSGNGIASQPDSSWHVQGVGDFNGDGASDILWRNNNGTLAVWTMGGATGTTLQSGDGVAAAPDGAWRIVGTGDFNGDGKSDILWRNNQSGIAAVWTMGGDNGAQIQSGNAIAATPGLDWHVAGTGDFNGDGASDILWRNDSGALIVWDMGGADGATIVNGSALSGVADLSWKIETTGDFNADGKCDILWRNTSGALDIWTMGGATGGTVLTNSMINSAPDANWSVQKHVFEVV